MSIFGKNNVTTRAEQLTELQATISQYTAVPYLFGTCKVGSNLIEHKGLESKERKTVTKSGKSKTTQIDYLYYAKLVLALGEKDSGISLGNVWVGTDKYNSLNALNSSGESGSGLTFNPNGCKPYDQDYDLALCYGRVYLGTNASVPSYSFEVKGLFSSNDEPDANPADIIKFLLEELGLGSYIDSGSWNNYKSFCENAGILVSTPADYFKEQKKAQEIIKDLLTITNTYMFWSVDKFKFVPCYPARMNNWEPDLTVQYSLTKNDFLKNSFNFKRKDSSQQYNVVKVSFSNRANEYENESISYINKEDAAKFGIRQTEVNVPWVHKKETAVKLAKMLNEKYLNEVTRYSFKLDWCFARLEPGDLVSLSYPELGINEVVRVSEVQEDSQGILDVTAISTPIAAYGESRYSVRNQYEYIDYNVAPGMVDAPLIFTPPSELVSSNTGVEIWMALRGSNNYWGGCRVYVSNNDENFSEVGIHGLQSLYGEVLSDSGTEMSLILGNAEQMELLPEQKIWVNGEVLAYEKAAATDKNTYTISGLARGLNGTLEVTHSSGEKFAVLDGGLYVLQPTKADIGKTLYFKFPSFNVYKSMAEDINELDSYSYTAALYNIPSVTGVVAVASGFSITTGINSYQINVRWTKPLWQDYDSGMVYYKKSGGQWTYADSGETNGTIPQVEAGATYTVAVCTKDIHGNYQMPDGAAQTNCTVQVSAETPNTPTGFAISYGEDITVSWNIVTNAIIRSYEVRSSSSATSTTNILASVTSNSTKINLSSRSGKLYLFAVSVYGKRSAAAVLNYSKAAPAKPSLPIVKELVRGLSISMQAIPTDSIGIKLYINDDIVKITNEHYSYNGEAGVYDIKYRFYDVFGDGALSDEQRATIPVYIDSSLLEAESITADLLSKATQDALDLATSAVQTETLNSALSKIDVTKQLGNYYTKTETDNKITAELGSYDPTTKLTNYYTKTETANKITTELGKYDPTTKLSNYYTKTETADKIAAELGSYDPTKKLTNYYTKTETATAITSQLSSYAKTSDVTNSLKSYSTITQLNNAIGLCVATKDYTGNTIMSKINLGDGTVTIAGKYIHITGDTVFDNNVIVGNALQSKSITTDKLDVTSLSAISATIGTLRTKTSGSRVEIKDNLIQVYDSSNKLRVRLGVW